MVDVELLRPVSPQDLLFVASIGLLVGGAISDRLLDRNDLGRPLATIGWACSTVVWGIVAATYLSTGRWFLGAIGLVTVIVAAYAVTLVIRRRRAGRDLTVAFAVMGLLFLPFEFVAPIHRAVLGGVATHTAWGLTLLGYEPIVGYGPKGYVNVIYFSGRPLSHSIRIISACSGISAIALFVGLIAATTASIRQRVLASVGVVALIYALNIVRAMLVAGALGGEWFGFATGTVGVTDPAIASYYVAEYVFAQVLVVLVLLSVYAKLSARFTELQRLVDGVLESAASDARWIAQR